MIKLLENSKCVKVEKLMKKILFNLFLVILTVGLFLPSNANASANTDIKEEVKPFMNVFDKNHDQLQLVDNVVNPQIYLEATRTQNKIYSSMAQVPDRIQYSEKIGGLTYTGWLNLVTVKPQNGQYNATFRGVINVWID